MEPANWPPSHCEALREFVSKGMSYRDAANAVNARFGTAYSRNAALGRGRRMGLAEVERPKPPPTMTEARVQPAAKLRLDEFALLKRLRRRPVFLRLEGVPLRCVEVVPRHLDLLALEEGDCRYPYGGDDEGGVITFCGRRRHKGSSYCTSHLHLTRNPKVRTERTPSRAPLRLVAGVGSFKIEEVRNGTQEAQESI